jgi:5-formyltetrahydrofolate cyclo-ligase
MDARTAKRLLRERIWTELETKNIARFPLPCFGRIPNFAGSDKAAEKVRLLKEWTEARVVFANPDFAQQKVREYALLDGKLLVMASLRLKHGYVLVHPKEAEGLERFASTIRGAFKCGKAVNVQEVQKPDLIVEGSVAVDMRGNRLGKGGGYGDMEMKTMKRLFGYIQVVTTVHDMQGGEAVPFEKEDEKVSIIVTPTRVLRVATSLEKNRNRNGRKNSGSTTQIDTTLLHRSRRGTHIRSSMFVYV